MPHIPWAIWMEPRELDHQITKWDLGTEPPPVFTEVKLNPSRQEIVTWLQQVRHKASFSATAEFQLVYDRGGGQALLSLQQLVRNAIESCGDEGRFNLQIKSEGFAANDELLAVLGPTAQSTLARVKVLNIPESVLTGNGELFARHLAGESGGKRLVELLFHKFAEGVASRQRFLIQDLITDITGQGLQLHACPDVSCEDLDPRVLAALVVLQASPAGMPLEVLAEAISTPQSELIHALAPVLGKTVSSENDLLSIRPLLASFTCADRTELLGRTLHSLIAFIDGRKHEAVGKFQVRNAIGLAEACATRKPQLTATVFRSLDKLLKDIGDKHLVLRIAELSIRAARESRPRTSEVAQGEAHALICGRSWVYQRIDRLADARTAAEESLECGEDIRWDRNTAYCMKCIGRLCRLEAERASDSHKKKRLLGESASLIREAIARFSVLGEFGVNHPEVGDCYSLLGRTLLLDGQLSQAEGAIRKASELIADTRSKDFLDLLLLDGDFQVARGDRQAAEGCYGEALRLDCHPNPEVSEMRARAYFKRGLNFAAMGETTFAKQALRKAAELWQGLGEIETAAEAEWNEVLLLNEVSIQLKRLLQGEPFWVRVRVIRSHEKRVNASRKVRWARREEPGTGYWEHLIEEAKEKFRIEVPSW